MLSQISGSSYLQDHAWEVVSEVTSTVIGAVSIIIGTCKYSYLNYNLRYSVLYYHALRSAECSGRASSLPFMG